MIDDRLEEQAADKARISVSLDEVDNAIRNIAAQGKIDSRALIGEAKKQGLTEQDYRDELRRQVLEGKLVQLRVRGRVTPNRGCVPRERGLVDPSPGRVVRERCPS